jgi:hypothetical protein
METAVEYVCRMSDRTNKKLLADDLAQLSTKMLKLAGDIRGLYGKDNANAKQMQGAALQAKDWATAIVKELREEQIPPAPLC